MPLFNTPIFTEMILPFLFVFVLVFAILQKSKILGGEKAQIDALISLAIALIFIGVPVARDIVVNLMPWLAVGLAVIFVFMVLYGFVAGNLDSAPTWMKVVFGILSGLFVIGIVIYVTGLWPTIGGWFVGEEGGEIWVTILFLIIIAGAIGAVLAGSKKGKTSE